MPKEMAPFHMLCMVSPYPASSSTDTSSVVRIHLFGNMFDDRPAEEDRR
jgi:hypothetical protein